VPALHACDRVAENGELPWRREAMLQGGVMGDRAQKEGM